MPLRLRAGELSSDRIVAAHLIVTLAKARVHAMSPPYCRAGKWIPAFAGMTEEYS
jgi:hypothetical protein